VKSFIINLYDTPYSLIAWPHKTFLYFAQKKTIFSFRYAKGNENGFARACQLMQCYR